jgi:hypothetical protein
MHRNVPRAAVGRIRINRCWEICRIVGIGNKWIIHAVIPGQEHPDVIRPMSIDVMIIGDWDTRRIDQISGSIIFVCIHRAHAMIADIGNMDDAALVIILDLGNGPLEIVCRFFKQFSGCIHCVYSNPAIQIETVEMPELKHSVSIITEVFSQAMPLVILELPKRMAAGGKRSCNGSGILILIIKNEKVLLVSSPRIFPNAFNPAVVPGCWERGAKFLFLREFQLLPATSKESTRSSDADENEKKFPFHVWKLEVKKYEATCLRLFAELTSFGGPEGERKKADFLEVRNWSKKGKSLF